MRALIQRVSRARVVVGSRTVAAIGSGLLVLVGVAKGDGAKDLDFLRRKIISLRCFSDSQGRLNRSVADVGGAILVVSQFTLYGDCRKGTRPSFSRAAGRGKGETFYQELIEGLREAGLEVKGGQFGSMMKVELVNDGPVTLIVDSSRDFY